MIPRPDLEKKNVTLSNYLKLMSEIRKREEVIIELLDGSRTLKYLILNYEVIFFQLRKILEIIVKAPIITNEGEYRNISNRPEDDWRIRDIMKKLEQCNPKFYPQSIEIINIPNQTDDFKNRESGFLTKEELCIAYDYCNGYLHSENPLKVESEINFENEWKWIVEIMNKVHILLDKHIHYPANDENFFYFITMENGKGHPSGNVFETV